MHGETCAPVGWESQRLHASVLRGSLRSTPRVMFRTKKYHAALQGRPKAEVGSYVWELGETSC
eukprot:353839-Chlamydomonas_euryale.AAC.55